MSIELGFIQSHSLLWYIALDIVIPYTSPFIISRTVYCILIRILHRLLYNCPSYNNNASVAPGPTVPYLCSQLTCFTITRHPSSSLFVPPHPSTIPLCGTVLRHSFRRHFSFRIWSLILAPITKIPLSFISSHARYISSPLASSLPYYHFSLSYGVPCGVIFFSSRALSAISTITLSHFPGYLRGGLASILPYVRYSPVTSISRCCIDIYQGSHPSIHQHVTLMVYAISFQFHCAVQGDPHLLFMTSLRRTLRCSPCDPPYCGVLIPSRSNGVFICRLAEISPFEAHRCIRRSPHPVELRITDK